jgi:hypothetical protein
VHYGLEYTYFFSQHTDSVGSYPQHSRGPARAPLRTPLIKRITQHTHTHTECLSASPPLRRTLKRKSSMLSAVRAVYLLVAGRWASAGTALVRGPTVLAPCAGRGLRRDAAGWPRACLACLPTLRGRNGVVGRAMVGEKGEGSGLVFVCVFTLPFVLCWGEGWEDGNVGRREV